ncbi:MAG: hypothetical protein Fur0039_06930 [Rhodocyclaceae bacterium]
MMTRTALIALLSASTAAIAPPGAAAEVVGRVLMAAGDASALRAGKSVPLRYGAAIEDRDVLQTGPSSNLQVRFRDESIMSLRSHTQLRIDQFKFSGKPAATDSAFFRLVKGAFRTVTGLIGRSDHSRYGVVTPVATIGIRGTMYAASLCENDCFNADGSKAENGLYGMVIGPSYGTNEVTLKNKAPEPFVLGQGAIFHVASDTSEPKLLLEPPQHLIDTLAGSGKANRPVAMALGPAGGAQGAEGDPVRGGALAAGGIGSDSRPNALPGPIEQVAAVTSGFHTVEFTQNLGAGGLPSALPPISSGGFVAIGGTGIVRGQLLWATTADMDLHLLTPDGQHVYFANTSVNFPSSAPTATATLDIDNTEGISHPTAITTFRGTTHAVENIQVTGSAVPAGDYTFFARNFSGPTTAPVLIVTGDNGVTGRTHDIPALTSGATSGNYVVTRSASGTATYSP